MKKRIKVCLWGGWFGSRNKGDHVILVTVADLLRQHKPDCRIIVLTKNAQFVNTYMAEAGLPVEAIDKRNEWYKTIWHLLTCNLFAVTGGVPFYDKVSQMMIFLFFTVITRLGGGKAVMFGPSLMQMQNPLCRMLTKRIFGLMDLIAIREPWSINEIKKLGVRKKIFQTVEPGIVLHKATKARISEILCENDVSIEATRPLIGIVVRNLKVSHNQQVEHYRSVTQDDVDNLITAVAHTADYLNSVGRVVFLPMNTAGFDNDCVISQKIIEQMKNGEGVTIFDEDYSAAEMMGVISQCELMLVNRFHSMILSFASHVPFFSIAYEHKFDGMTERFGVPENNVDLVGVDANELRQRVEVVWHNRQQVKETITQKYDELFATLNVNVELMFDLAEKKKIDHKKYGDYFI